MLANHRFIVPALLSICLAACGGDDGDSDGSTVDAASASRQTPPMGASAVEAWLANGAENYKTWASEDAVHVSRDPSPHGFNRIYSNAAITDNATGTDAWPEGAAAVKELYASLSDPTPVGYAVYLKTADDSAGGANWYWYERVPGESSSPTVVADGLGNSGAPKQICVGCHMGAGSDAMHTPTPHGRDQVYTPVP